MTRLQGLDKRMADQRANKAFDTTTSSAAGRLDAEAIRQSLNNLSPQPIPDFGARATALDINVTRASAKKDRGQTILGTALNEKTEQRLNEQLQKALNQPHSRIYQPTYKGFLADQMSPEKDAMDNQPTVVDKFTRVPGAYGWGVERDHLVAEHKIITDDTRVDKWPVKKDHLA